MRAWRWLGVGYLVHKTRRSIVAIRNSPFKMFPWNLFFPIILLVETVPRVASTSPFGSLHQLVARQVDALDPKSIPPQCQDQCKKTTDIIVLCPSTGVPAQTCFCTPTFERDLLDCLNCLSTQRPSQTGEYQGLLDKQVATCNTQRDNPLPSLTVSGGATGTRTTSSGSPTTSGSSGSNAALRNGGTPGKVAIAAGLAALAFVALG